MNFLAHLYLSGESPAIRTGNFIGDFVKGRNLAERFDPEVVKGIMLHREIDWFTDHHLVVKQSKSRLREKYRHYSGVIVDIFYDHFLAKGWDRYSSQLLPDFAEECYDLLQKQSATLPEEVNFLLPYMMKGNWLVNYSKLEGIHKALSGMARRAKHESRMDEAINDLEVHYEAFEQEFVAFFPELQSMCATWLAGQSSA